MPDIDKLKQFGSIVKSLGSEPAISDGGSESSEDIQLEGGEELPSDLSSLIDAAAEAPEQQPEDADNIEEYGSIDDIALESDLRKDVTPDLLKIDDSEGGIADFGESTDQIDLGEGESPSFEPGETEFTKEESAGGGPEDFSLPEDFSFGEEAPSETGGEEAGLPDFTLPDTGSDTQVPDEESVEPALTGTEDMGIDSFDLGGGKQEPPGESIDDFSSIEETAEAGGGAGSFDDLEFSIPEEAPQDDIGKVSGFESIGENFDLPESADESLDAGGETEEAGTGIDNFEIGDVDFGTGGTEDDIPGQSPADEAPGFEAEVEEGPSMDFGVEEPQVSGGAEEEEFPIDQLGELELPDMGEAGAAFEAPPAEDERKPERGRRREEPSTEGRNFSDREFAAIQATLSSLPRNLRLKVQSAIGKSVARGEQLARLLNYLIRGANAADIAALVTQITGEQIVIPKQFEKRTGFAYEEERRSFRYVFKKNIVPLLTIMIPLLLVIGFLVFIGIKASSWIEAQGHYNKGLELITKQKRFAEGNKEFDLGYKLAPDTGWFYKYAEAFIGENQYADAQDKYEQLLGLTWKGEKIDYMGYADPKGILDYASMESRILSNYRKADTLLSYLVFKDNTNKDAILARGDNFLDWADNQSFKFEMAAAGGGEPTIAKTEKGIMELYESARLAYAEYRNRFGESNTVRFRFLHYFIRTDNFTEAKALKDSIQANPDVKVDPLVYAELGGYLMDRNELLDVRDILNRASKANPSLPEIHYQFARYLEHMDQTEGAQAALAEAIRLMNAAKPLSMRRILMLIDSHNKLGKLYYDASRIQDAEVELEKAIRMIENPEQKALFGINPRFGEVYFNRGNILYDTKDFDIALELFTKAKAELYSNPDLDYKLGYINYRNSDYDAALLDFYNAEEGKSENANTLYAVGNTLFAKENYFAAQGYFEHLIEVLERTKAGITSLRPAENPVHLSILNLIMRAYNNLGITMKRLSERPRNPMRESEALAYLTRSQEYYDLLERSLYESGSTAQDKLKRNLAYLNQRYILYPVPGYDLYIYDDLPLDPETTYIDDLFSSSVKLR